MPFNIETYLPYFDEFDISREKKVAMIEAMYYIAQATVDLAHGVPQTLFKLENNESVEEFFERKSNDPVFEEEWFKEYEKDKKP